MTRIKAGFKDSIDYMIAKVEDFKHKGLSKKTLLRQARFDLDYLRLMCGLNDEEYRTVANYYKERFRNGK